MKLPKVFELTNSIKCLQNIGYHYDLLPHVLCLPDDIRVSEFERKFYLKSFLNIIVGVRVG